MLGQPLTVTDNLNNVSHLRYYNHFLVPQDPLANTGAIKSAVDENGNETDFAYTLANQTSTVTLPATGQSGTGRGVISYSYVYSNGPTATAGLYNESNTLIRQISPVIGLEGETTTATGNWNPFTLKFDADYRVVSVTDSKNQQTNYTINATGNLAQVTYPGGDTLQATAWDLDGNVLTAIDGRGNTIQYQYHDPTSQLTKIIYPQAFSALNVQLGYDAHGRLSSVSDASGGKTYTYDDNDALTGYTVSYNNNLASAQVSYGSYPDGSLQQMTATVGTQAYTWNYSYDGDGELTGLTSPFGENFSWSYAANGWVKTQQYGSFALTSYTLDPLGHLLDQATVKLPGKSSLSDFNATGTGHYDGAGNLLSFTSSLPAAPTSYSGATTYTLDALSQILQEQSGRNGGYTESFGYDSVGNTTTFRGTTENYNSDNQNVLIPYDGDGNPTAWQNNALTFDLNDKLTAIGSLITAVYDADGLRVSKQSASGTTFTLYDGDTPLCEFDATGNVTAVNTWGVNGLLARHNGNLLTGSSVFYTFDLAGNTAQRLDGSGNVLGSSWFDAFGEGQVSDNSTDPYSGFGAQYGYYLDSETGLYLLGQRYYDPSQGRFVNRDPIGYAGGIDVYAFCSNNPVMNADPSGLQQDAKQYWSQVGQFLAGELKGTGNFLVASGTSTLPFYSFIPQPIQERIENPFVASSSDEGDGIAFGKALVFFGSFFVGGAENSTRIVSEEGAGSLLGKMRALTRRFMSKHHVGDVTVTEGEEIVFHTRIRSGNATREEAELGLHGHHVETRACTNIPLNPKRVMTIKSLQSPPCPGCQREMIAKAAKTGAKIIYKWKINGKWFEWRPEYGIIPYYR